MLVLNLCQKFCPDKIPCITNNKLGDGADGEVFDIADDNGKVIKFCILYQNDDHYLPDVYNQVKDVLDYLINTPVHTYARVYSQKYMGEFSRTVWGGEKQNYIMYYYIMEKLNKISEDESKVFHSLISHEDRGIKKNFSILKIKEMLQGMGKSLDFDAEKVIFFIDNLNNNQITHLDIHVRNIMKDSNGNFKLIDFDRAQIKRK